MASVG
jgi:hypothetical protein